MTLAMTYTAQKLVPAMDEEEAIETNWNFPVSISYPKGTVVGEVTATPGLAKAYLSGSTDGSQIPIGVTAYDLATDSSGNVFVGSLTAASEFGESSKAAPVYQKGYFRTADLTGLDANAVSKLGKLVSGSVTAGILRID